MSGQASAVTVTKFQRFMNHPAGASSDSFTRIFKVKAYSGITGPKTVFFWAPIMKWCLVAAGLKDLNRPADKLSVSQNVALAATGFIWVRYSFVITPVNYSLAAVNFFVGTSGVSQLYRIWDYRRKNPAPAPQLAAD